jgi:GNAT superfamily N-acetyltransferase
MIWQARSDAEIARCFPVMRELRAHLDDSTAFVARVKNQMAQGYRLTALEEDGEVRALAGWRISENLAWGKFLYVDDLITRAADRSRGHGESLFAWLVAEARREGCEQFHLDSGVQRFGAHRFYLAQRMEITSHHFGLQL